MTTREVTMVGGPLDGRQMTLAVHTIEFPDEGWSGVEPLTVHTYSVRRDEQGVFYGRYDGSHQA